MTLVTVFAILLLGSTSAGRLPATATTLHVIPQESAFLDDTRHYEASLQIGRYMIRRDGLVRRDVADSPGIQQSLPLEPNYRIDTLYALSVDRDLLVFYEASNELESSGTIARLDGRTLATKWASAGPGMNIAPPVVCGDSICAAGHGSVARLVLATGRVVWSHTDLYTRLSAFNTPENLAVNHGKLFVHESLASYDHRAPMTLVIDLESGEYSVK